MVAVAVWTWAGMVCAEEAAGPTGEPHTVVASEADGNAEDEPDEQPRVRFVLMSGSARAIPQGLSASRDAAAFSILITPYTVIAAGGDLSILTFHFRKVSLRLGLYGSIELESSVPYNIAEDGLIGVFPVANTALWRGLNGGSVGLSFDEWARRRSSRAALEIVLSFRHESEHFSGPGDGEPRWLEVPHIGDFLMPEVAVRLPVGPVDFELRLQLKAFLHTRYIVGPGVDAIIRWRAHRRVHPFLSTFFEYLIGGERQDGTDVWDVYLLRAHLGVSFPGRVGDVQLFLSLAQGHGKGVNAALESFRFGGGLRMVLPSTTSDWRASDSR